MKRILWIGDGVAKTGFSTVNMNIIKNLLDTYEVHHLAINYYGDPHEYTWKIYPAGIRGDLWGFNRIKEFSETNADCIFILNDIWVIAKYLELIKSNFKKVPPIVVYFPVDSEGFDKDWFANFDIVSRLVVYTNFGYRQVRKAYAGIEPDVIPHGVDLNTFFKINAPKSEIKAKMFPNKDDFLDSFIILNANRNQPRKRIDITVKGFQLFARNKPENVKLYLHMGLKDMGWDLVKLTERLKIHDRLIITSRTPMIQQVPEDKLNLIYNACDVGLNTSIGEGWGLVNHEHAVTGAPQIVADHSANSELYKDCGILIPPKFTQINAETLTTSKIITPENVAKALEKLYYNKELYGELSRKSQERFASKQFSWEYIVENYWKKLFREVLGDN